MKRAWIPVTAGILNVISGVFALIGGMAVASIPGTPMSNAIVSYYIYSTGSGAATTESVATLIIRIVATLLIFLGVTSLLGGIYALRRKFWGLTLAGAVFSLFYLPPLGIPSTIFTLLSRREFAQSGGTGNSG